MLTRAILASILAIGTAGAALADVKVNTPGVQVETPAGGAGVNVDVGAKNALTPTDAWIGRPVYSSDGKHIGEISAISGDQIYADIGGFLGIGETRVLLQSTDIASVKEDRVDLTITQAQADKLPAADKAPAAQ
jgi:hypothetical protein